MTEEFQRENPFLKSPKYQVALESLPESMREDYKSLVQDYYYASLESIGKGFAAYDILARLIREGWTRKNPIEA